jgi:hypothetical protein
MANPAPPPVPETPPPRRIRKRLYLPVILILLMIVVGVGFYVRGVWADTTERNPATADVGTITQLFRQPDGTVVVRCAIVIDAPPSATWGVVSGYDKHNEFMPYISKVEATKKDGGVVIVEGTAHSRIWGDWPFRSETTHRETPAAGEYSASWSEENKDVFKINRGSWKIVPNGSNKNQTLLVFTLQIELKDYPDAIVRNVIMDRLHTILKAVRDETLRRKKA